MISGGMAQHSPVPLQSVMNALRAVRDPDVIGLGLVRDVKLGDGGRVSFKLARADQRLQDRCRDAVAALPGVTHVEVGVELPPAGKLAPAQQPGPARALAIPGVKSIIAVSSGKGGVGKSTVAVNLACALARSGAKVGLIDADVYGPNVPTMLGVIDQPQVQEENGAEFFIPPTARNGIKVMSMGFLVQGDQPMIWRGPMLHSVVNQFCHRVHWGELDYLVVDMPPGTGDVQLSLAQLVPVTGAVLVTTPQEVSLQDVRKAHAMFEKVRIPILGVVENMSTFKCDGCDKEHAIFGEGGGERLSKKFGVELLAKLPLVPSVRAGGDAGRPVVDEEPASPMGRAFAALAARVVDQVAALSRTAGDVQITGF